jgi:hypothetical protein
MLEMSGLLEFICCKGSDGSLSVRDGGVIAIYNPETLRTQRGVQKSSYVTYHRNAYKAVHSSKHRR